MALDEPKDTDNSYDVNGFKFIMDKEFDEKAVSKNLTPESKPILEHLIAEFSNLREWSPEPIHDIVIKTGEKFDVKLGKVAQPIRVAVTGSTMSPPINETLHLLGKDKTITRLQNALSMTN